MEISVGSVSVLKHFQALNRLEGNNLKGKICSRKRNYYDTKEEERLSKNQRFGVDS